MGIGKPEGMVPFSVAISCCVASRVSDIRVLGRPPDPSGAARISDEIKPNPAGCLLSKSGAEWGVALSSKFCAPDPVDADVPATGHFAGLIFGFSGGTEKSRCGLSTADSSLDGCKFFAADDREFPA